MRKRKSLIIPGSIITDSLTILQQLENLPKEYTSLDMSGVATDTLVKQMYPNMKTINYKDELYVMYTKEEESITYSNTGHYIMRPLTVPNYEISVVQMLKGPVSFYANGGMHDAKSLFISPETFI